MKKTMVALLAPRPSGILAMEVGPAGVDGLSNTTLALAAAAAVPNLYIAESVRRHYADEYIPIVGELAKPVDGFFDLPSGPGLGMDLAPEVLTRPDLKTHRSEV